MNPILVEVTRGALVESRHRGAIAVCDAAGKLVAAWGDVDAAVYPRSAFKSLQTAVNFGWIVILGPLAALLGAAHPRAARTLSYSPYSSRRSGAVK